MRTFAPAGRAALGVWLSLFLAACGDDNSVPPDAGVDVQPDGDGGPCVPAPPGQLPDGGIACGTAVSSDIQHLVVIVQENHSFDSYFGRYCMAPTGSNPTCNDGPTCCEAGPATDPGAHAQPAMLDDFGNADFDPDHTQACELAEINGGRMDHFVQGATCSDPRTFAYAPASVLSTYIDYAGRYALADHYFQPVAGQSSMNDMYFARARFVFLDNAFYPQGAIGSQCGLGTTAPKMEYTDPTIGDLLLGCGVSFRLYIEGYDTMKAAVQAGICPPAPLECGALLPFYPCVYDPSDIPFAYYPTLRDRAGVFVDRAQLDTDLAGATLPQVSFVKLIGYKTEHPGLSTTISDGEAAVSDVVDAILSSNFGASTLVLLAYDESGGYFDHVPPPPANPVDCQPYGARVPFFAIGPFAKTDYISHVPLEHSSVVRFIEWNWLGARTGQLGNRDANVHNIGDLLSNTGTPVPSN